MLNVCNKYKTATILLVLVCNTAVFSQEYTSNIAKYWYYRSRLDYFVVPGEKQGESQIVCVRNKTFSDTDPLIGPVWGGKNVDYGQHGKYTGLYWGVLATEYYLLQSYGRNEEANRTLSELSSVRL